MVASEFLRMEYLTALQVFGGAAGYDKNIVDYAKRLATEIIQEQDPDGFMSLVEVVAAETKGNAMTYYSWLCAVPLSSLFSFLLISHTPNLKNYL